MEKVHVHPLLDDERERDLLTTTTTNTHSYSLPELFSFQRFFFPHMKNYFSSLVSCQLLNAKDVER